MRLSSLDEILRYAIWKEADEAAFYEIAPEPALKKLLLILAQEEIFHKGKLEKIYDDEILKEF